MNPRPPSQRAACAIAVAIAMSVLACGDDATHGVESDAVADATDVVAEETESADTVAADAVAATDTDTDTDTDAASLPATFGGERPASVFYPASYDPGATSALVILLHGYSATGAIQDAYLHFHEVATARGYVAIVPTGTLDNTGAAFWNADPSWCCNFYGSTVDDQAYLLGLVDEAKQALHIDPARVYLIGHSNGGFMAHRMACDHADVFAGVASIAGSLPDAVSSCAPSAPVTVLQVHGTADAVIAYAGTPGSFPGALAIADRWVSYDRCDQTAAVSPAVDYDSFVASNETIRSTWTGCDGGAAVALWTLTASGHVPGFTDTFMPAVFDFLESHTRAAR